MDGNHRKKPMIFQEIITHMSVLMTLLTVTAQPTPNMGFSSPQPIFRFSRKHSLVLQEVCDTLSFLKTIWKPDYPSPAGFSMSEDLVLQCSHF